MKYQGEFRPPMMGLDKVPIPITGQGSLEVTDAGLVVDGFRVKGLTGCMAGILFIIYVFGSLTVSLKMGLDIDTNWILYPGLIALGFFTLKGRRRKSGKPWQFTIPWEHVSLVGALDGAIELLIEKSKPTGKVYFYPSEDHAKLVEQLKAKRES